MRTITCFKDLKCELRRRFGLELAKGEVDQEALDVIHRLNAIPAVATAYSCIGHNKYDLDYPYLAFYVDRPISMCKPWLNNLSAALKGFSIHCDVEFVRRKYLECYGKCPGMPIRAPFELECVVVTIPKGMFDTITDLVVCWLEHMWGSFTLDS